MRAYDRLSGDAEFARVRRRGRRLDGLHVAIVATPSRRGRPRVGIVPTKGFRSAVERNRVRRRVRAALETVGLPGNAVDMIVIARQSARDAAFSALCDDFRAAFSRIPRLGAA